VGVVDRHDWDARYAETELVWSAEPNRFVETELAALAPGRALDLAAGEGRNAIWLATRGWTVTVVDFSRVALEKASNLAAAARTRVTRPGSTSCCARHSCRAAAYANRSQDRPPWCGGASSPTSSRDRR